MSKTIITPELKDKLLNELVEKCEVSELTLINIDSLAKDLQTTSKVIEGIFNQFVDIGLCTPANYRISGELHVILNVEAHDMVRRGGFTAKEKILEDNLKKLSFEIEELRPKYSEKVARMASIISNIATFYNIAMHNSF